MHPQVLGSCSAAFAYTCMRLSSFATRVFPVDLVALQDEVIGARPLHTHGNAHEPPAKITATRLIKEHSNPPRLITGSGTADAQLKRVRAELEETSAALNAMTNKYETMRRVLISKRDIFLAQRKEVAEHKRAAETSKFLAANAAKELAAMKRATAEKTRESADMKSMRWELQVQTARADEFLERLAMYEPDVITTWTGGDDDEADIEPSPEVATIIFTSPSSEFITGELQRPSVGCLHPSFCHDLREQDEAALEKVMKAVAKAAKAAAAKAAAKAVGGAAAAEDTSDDDTPSFDSDSSPPTSPVTPPPSYGPNSCRTFSLSVLNLSALRSRPSKIPRFCGLAVF